MKKISFLLAGVLALNGCANLLSERPCISGAQEFKPVIQVQKVKQTPKLAATIYFTDGSFSLTKAEKQGLKQIAAQAQKTGADLKIVGHASSRTRQTTLIEHTMINLGISGKRAVSVVKTLAQYGMPLHKMRYEALADSQPAAPEVNAEAEALNRRVEIFYLYKE